MRSGRHRFSDFRFYLCNATNLKVKFRIDRSNSHKKLPKVFRKVCKFTITIVCKTEEFCCLCTLSETLWAIFCVNWIDQF